MLLAFVLPVVFYLILNELILALFAIKSTVTLLVGFKTGSYLPYYHKIPDTFE